MKSENQTNRIDRRARWTITIIALALVAARVFDASIFQRLDVIAVGLLVIAALPWAASFLSEISVPGVLDAKFRALEEKIQETQDQADNATRQAIASEDLVLKPLPSSGALTGDALDTLKVLGQRYVATRSSMKSGDERTSTMTAIFRDMSAAAGNFEGEWPLASRWLLASDAGMVLAAIAYDYVHNDEADVSPLIAAALSTKQPFIQYWALRVVLDIVRSTGLKMLSQKDIADLRAMESQLAKGTDRAFLVSSINKSIEKQLG
jgi:hypothetical protein